MYILLSRYNIIYKYKYKYIYIYIQLIERGTGNLPSVECQVIDGDGFGTSGNCVFWLKMDSLGVLTWLVQVGGLKLQPYTQNTLISTATCGSSLVNSR